MLFLYVAGFIIYVTLMIVFVVFDGIKDFTEACKRLDCFFFGHIPRGPLLEDPNWKYNLHIPPVLYKCDRCKRRIYFENRKWRVL